MKKILVFIKKQPTYVLINYFCCIISIIFNIIAAITNNNILRLIAWIFIIIQLSCVLIQIKIYKFNIEVMKDDIFLDFNNIIDMNKYKPEYRNKPNIIYRIKSRFKRK